MNFTKCFPDAIFQEKDEIGDMICPINLGVFNEPVTDSCGHTFCRRCISEWLKNNNKCPYSRKIITEEGLVEAVAIGEEINKKAIFCLFRLDGCAWEGRLCELGSHLASECGFTRIRCQNFERCGTETLRRQMGSHWERCEFRVLGCEFCKKLMELQFYQKHLETCEDNKSTCQRCRAPILKSKTQEHYKNACAESVTGCIFEEYGCKYQAKRKELEAHFQGNLFAHFALMKSFQDGEIRKVREDNNRIKEQISNYKAETRDFVGDLASAHERTVMRLKTQNSQQVSLLEKLKKDNQELREQLSSTKGDFLKEFKAMQQYIDFSVVSSINQAKSVNFASIDDPLKLGKGERGKLNTLEEAMSQQKKILAGGGFGTEHNDARMKNFSVIKDIFGQKISYTSDFDFEKTKPKRMVPLVCHSDVIEDACLIFPATGKSPLIATCSGDRLIKIWSLQSFNCQYVRALEGHTNCVGRLIYIPAKKLLVSGSNDSTVRIWSTENWQCVKVIKAHEDSVLGLTYIKEQNYLGSCSVDKFVNIWDLGDDFCLKVSFTLGEVVTECLYINLSEIGGNAFIISGDAKGTLYWSDVDFKGKKERVTQKKVIKAHDDAIFKLVFINSMRLVVSTSFGDEKIKIWNPLMIECIRDISIFEKGSVSVFYDPCSEMLFTQGTSENSCLIKIIKLETFKVIRVFKDEYSLKNAIWIPEKNVLLSFGGTIGWQGKMNLLFF